MMMALPAVSALPQSGSIISRWKLEETSGTRSDDVGSNNLTDNNTVTGGTGKFGDTCSDFEAGNSESLSIADASQSGLDFAGSFTLACWVKLESSPSGAGTDYQIMRKYGTYGYSFYVNSADDLGLYINTPSGDDNIEFAQTFTVGEWTHVAMVYATSTRVTLYINGVQVSESTSSISTNSTANTGVFYLGRNATASYFDGLMQDAMCWSVALTDAEVAQLYNAYGKALPDNDEFPQSGSIAARWKLDEVSGTRADSVGSSNLSDNNTVTAEAGQFNKIVADFEDDNNEYLSVADNAALSITGDLCFTYWAKHEGTMTSGWWQVFAKFDSGTTRSWQHRIYYDGGNTTLELYVSPNTNGSGATYANVDWDPIGGIWYHVGCVYDASAGETKFYINGQQIGATQTSQATSIADSTSAFEIGRWFDADQDLDGVLQDVVIWDGVELTDDEMEQAYNIYFNLPATADFPQSGSLVARWTLTDGGFTRMDSVGTSHLTDNNTVTSSSGIIEDGASAERAADFERDNNEYLSIADNAALSITGDMSYFCWVKFETHTMEDSRLMDKLLSSGNHRSYYFVMTTNGTDLRYGNYSNGTSGSDTNFVRAWEPTDGVWYHLGFVYDASAGEGKLYVDGTQLGSTETGMNNSVYDGAAQFTIGGASNYHDGLMQDAMLWNAELSDAEVTTLYELYTVAAATGVPSGLTLLGVGI
jgi:hypothetical protein